MILIQSVKRSVSNAIHRIKLRAHVKLARSTLLYRSLKINRPKTIQVIRPDYIGKRAVVSNKSDGWYLGGEVIIDQGARLSDFSLIDSYGGRIAIGKNFYIGNHSILLGFGGISIGDNVMIGPHSSIISSSHGFKSADKAMREQEIDAIGIVIESDVWIGAGVRILDGVTIESGAIIGAGSVVTSNVLRGEIRAGVPARTISTRNEARRDG